MNADFLEWQIAHIFGYLELNYPEVARELDIACGVTEVLEKCKEERTL